MSNFSDTYLLTELRKIQKRKGFVSEESIKELSKKTKIPVSKIYSVATFYSKIHTKSTGKNIIEICDSPSCYLNGSLKLINYLEKKIGIKSGETTRDKKFSLFICSCIGCCDGAPAMLLNDKPYKNLTKKKIDEILRKCKS